MQQDRSRQATWVLAGIVVLLVAVFAVLAAYTFTRDRGGDSANAAPVTVTVTSTPAEQPAPQPAPSPIDPPSIAAPPVTGPPATVPTPADEGSVAPTPAPGTAGQMSARRGPVRSLSSTSDCSSRSRAYPPIAPDFSRSRGVSASR